MHKPTIHEKCICVDVEKFNPEKKEWSRMSSLSHKRGFARGTILRGKVLVFGGYGKNYSDLREVLEMYDPTNERWSSIECRNAPIHISDVVTFKGKVFVLGSAQLGESTGVTLHAYDVDKDEWQICSQLSLDKAIYVIAPLRIPKVILSCYHR